MTCNGVTREMAWRQSCFRKVEWRTTASWRCWGNLGGTRSGFVCYCAYLPWVLRSRSSWPFSPWLCQTTGRCTARATQHCTIIPLTKQHHTIPIIDINTQKAAQHKTSHLSQRYHPSAYDRLHTRGCLRGNQPSIAAARGPKPRQLSLISQKSQSEVRGEEARSRKGKTKEAERVCSIPIILGPNLRLSKLQQGVSIQTRTLQPPASLRELTIDLPQTLVFEESAIIITTILQCTDTHFISLQALPVSDPDPVCNITKHNIIYPSRKLKLSLLIYYGITIL